MRRWLSRPQKRTPFVKAQLLLEVLEDRSLPSATTPDYILVQYRDQEVVQKIEIDDGLTAEQALAAYNANANVAFAELDHEVSVAVVPNDPSYGQLYGLNNTGQSGGRVDADIDAPEAWDLTVGSMRVVVGVIDTGIDYTHPDLYLNIWINQGEIPTAIRAALTDVDGDGLITFRDLNTTVNQGAGKITDLNGNGYIDGGDLLRSTSQGGWANGGSDNGDGYVDDLVGWDFINNDNDPMDDNGHGTHVAGTIGAIGNNGIGVTGVNWRVQMAGLKFLGSGGSGSTSGATAALNYAVARGIPISNNSWGGGGYSTSLYNAINAARTAGHVFVAAAGNNGRSNDTTANYPSNYALDNVIAVAATDRNDNLASFSNYGATTVDLGAPGVSIVSTYPGNRYATLSGTSMATPHVAGVVALVKAAAPGLSYSQLISRVVGNLDPLTSLSGKTVTGGRLNAFKAVSGLSQGDTTAPRVLSAVANGTGTSPVNSVRVTFSEAINAATFTPADITLFTGPNGSLTASGVQAVAGSNNTQFDVTFATQTTPGSYSFRIGPEVRDLANNAMEPFVAGFTITSAPTGYTFSGQYNAAIRDYTTTIAYLTVNQDLTLSDVNVQVNLTHTYTADLYITLVAPDGTSVLLFNRRGGSGDNLSGTVFDDEASRTIASGAAPFNGSYRADGLLSVLDGRQLRGTWQLRVSDRGPQDIGTLTFFGLTVQGSTPSSTPGGTPGSRALSETESEPTPVREIGSEAGSRRPAALALPLLPSVAMPEVTLPRWQTPAVREGRAFAPSAPVTQELANLTDGAGGTSGSTEVAMELESCWAEDELDIGQSWGLYLLS